MSACAMIIPGDLSIPTRPSLDTHSVDMLTYLPDSLLSARLPSLLIATARSWKKSCVNIEEKRDRTCLFKTCGKDNHDENGNFRSFSKIFDDPDRIRLLRDHSLFLEKLE